MQCRYIFLHLQKIILAVIRILRGIGRAAYSKNSLPPEDNNS
jgi:hypothetical protein